MARILLVEDDTNLREIYAARLEGEGYEVSAAADGEEALAEAVKVRPDLIILDVMMPKISGFDVLDILRSTPETKDSKVIMMTALSQDSDKERGEKLGTDRYLIKSQVTLEDVVSNVKELLNSGNVANSASAPTDMTAEPTLASSFPSQDPSSNDDTATPATEPEDTPPATAAPTSPGLIIEEPEEASPPAAPTSINPITVQDDDDSTVPDATAEPETEESAEEAAAPTANEEPVVETPPAPEPVELPAEPSPVESSEVEKTEETEEVEEADNPIAPPAPEDDSTAIEESTPEAIETPETAETAETTETATAPEIEEAKTSSGPPVIAPLGEPAAPLVDTEEDDTEIANPRPGETIHPSGGDTPSSSDNDEPPIRPHEIAL